MYFLFVVEILRPNRRLNRRVQDQKVTLLTVYSVSYVTSLDNNYQPLNEALRSKYEKRIVSLRNIYDVGIFV